MFVEKWVDGIDGCDELSLIMVMVVRIVMFC